MKTICLYFQIHQPLRFRRYRFFDIGISHYYFDDYANESIMRKVAQRCYLPANQILNDLINEYGQNFRFAFSISGVALDQFELYAPEVLESFKKLAKTGCVEFLAETYNHSLSSLINTEEFIEQVEMHSKKIEELFGVKPKVFRNTELVYSDSIGATVADMGFKAMLTEGAKHILGWKSPNYIYYNAKNPKLKILLKNYILSDDIAFRFSNKSWSEWPLTAEKYVSWLNKLDKKEDVVNIFMDYETFGEHQWADSGIFEFLKAFPRTVFGKTKLNFSTPAEVAQKYEPVAPINVAFPISWADEERDLTAWLGNDMQNEAFKKLYELRDIVKKCNDHTILADWKYLQVSDHFYYMSTKLFSDGQVHKYFNPYESPYHAFINYMNVLSDFSERVKNNVSESEMEVSRLSKIIKEKNDLIEKLKNELNRTKEETDTKTPAVKTSKILSDSQITSATNTTRNKLNAKPEKQTPKKKNVNKK